MAKSARNSLEISRGSFTTWFTFMVGVPLGVGALFLIEKGPWQNETIQRYVHHLAEQAVVILFFCCLSAFVAKLVSSMKERYAHGQKLLAAWDGKPVAASEVTQLQQALNLVWDSVKSTYLGRRIANVLNFVASRDGAEDLDDQMRTLSDNDAIALDGTYALLRFLIWAMPILGFLGTVLGITEAIVAIDVSDDGGMKNVTAGLSKAFDATALAARLDCWWRCSSIPLLEKMEQGLLAGVDQVVDGAARRIASSASAQAEAASFGSAVAGSAQHLMEKQVGMWSDSMMKKRKNARARPPRRLAQALVTSLSMPP